MLQHTKYNIYNFLFSSTDIFTSALYTCWIAPVLQHLQLDDRCVSTTCVTTELSLLGSGYLPGSDTLQEASGRATILDYDLWGLEVTTCARSACYLVSCGTPCFTAADILIKQRALDTQEENTTIKVSRIM